MSVAGKTEAPDAFIHNPEVHQYGKSWCKSYTCLLNAAVPLHQIAA
jgi:hypothetical protein